MRTYKFKAQSTKQNAFFAAVNQMFSSSSQLPITTEHVVIKSDNETVLSSSRKLGGATEHLKGGVLANQKQLLLFSC